MRLCLIYADLARRNYFLNRVHYPFGVVVVNALNPLYIALYMINYTLTGLVVIQNWSSDVMHGYVYGTFTGAAVGLLFGPYGVAACGIGGGIFGALRNYVMPKEKPVRQVQT